MSRKSAFVAAACCLLLSALRAQQSRGSITGQVTDASGAMAARVKVTATNTATNVAVSAATNSTGNYTIFYLVPGKYDVTASLSGFANVERTGIEVQVATASPTPSTPPTAGSAPTSSASTLSSLFSPLKTCALVTSGHGSCGIPKSRKR